ncbi:DMT family transporter [Janthinobacterium fluminis]|uniref:DMT family transporter n=1 Tax=Janthinobacterium fluminis TaxID=2987524 RepID=A0ABT5K189_9BURK|nr:DMT family transporter [Janthinobacterium fluminis]MDC8758746.1 DMT family transporter [Janthinobacterium fluminis]
MSATRKPLDGFAAGLMLVLCLCWGLQQVAVKATAPSMSPMLQTGLRCGGAALLVWALMRWRGQRFAIGDGTLWPGIAAGVLFAAEFLCVALGLNYTSASHIVVFLYAAPIFTVLGLHWGVAGERLGHRQWLGICAAFAGIALAFSNGLGEAGGGWGRTLIGDALALLGSLFWAATTIVVRRSALSEAAPTTTLLYQLAVAALILLALAIVGGDVAAVKMTGMAWLSLFFQVVVIAFASYLAWFWMLRRYLASRIATFSFLTPLFGVGFGVALLGEQLSLRFGAGAALVLAGIVLVNLRRS